MFCVAAILAGAETAITTLWPWKMKKLASEEGAKSPFRALEKDITKVLTTSLVGVTFCTIFGTALATDVAIGLFGQAGVGYATVAITLVTLFIGEILPKSLAVAKPEPFARFALPLINALALLVTPVTWLAHIANKVLLSRLGVTESPDNVTQPELRTFISSASDSGAVNLYQEGMIEGVLDLDRGQVQQVMTPRVEIVAIEGNATLEELFKVMIQSKYSRVPVYKDAIDEIQGVVLLRELLANLSMRGASDPTPLLKTTVSTIMDPVYFIPECMSTMDALKQMRRQRTHMMVVVDEYGGTSGIVTLEDILETLVGEIYDEDDEEEVQEDFSAFVFNAEDGTYSIDGAADLDLVGAKLDLEDQVDPVLPDFATLSGFICSKAGIIPEVGYTVLVNRSDGTAVRFTVLSADDRRLLSLSAANVVITIDADGEASEVTSRFVVDAASEDPSSIFVEDTDASPNGDALIENAAPESASIVVETTVADAEDSLTV
jgi:CBS domain containing-hemolysin-like protein